jgi:hypothetical protein
MVNYFDFINDDGAEVRMAHDLLEALPDLTSKGMCLVVYDIDEQPVGIVPLDPIQ